MGLRICLADEYMLVLDGVGAALSAAEDMEVVATTHTAADVLPLVGEHLPDLVLLGHLEGDDGSGCLREIKARHPDVKVVVLAASDDARDISDALGAGASAYISKRIDPKDLASALRQVASGVVYHRPPDVGETPTEHLEAEKDAAGLTERELTMLEAISRGWSTKVISREYWISEKTVKFHLTNVYRKIGVHNRAEALRYAFEHDLVPRPGSDPALAVGA